MQSAACPRSFTVIWPNWSDNTFNFYTILQDEVRSSSDEWSALGMRGNQSSPVVCEGVLSADRLIGSFGELKPH